MHDTGDSTEALLLPGVGNFFTSGRYTCSALKNGLQGDAVSGNSFLDNCEDLRFRIEECSKNGLVCMKMPEFFLLGTIDNYSCIFLS